MHKIKNVFFDLDRTLWDFETNSNKVISDLFYENNLEIKCDVSFLFFIKKYEEINLLLWDKYRKNEITKQQLRSNRFYNSMQFYNYDDYELGIKLDQEYVLRSPYQTCLLPGTIKTLKYLSLKYKLHIITNGFKEVQHIKLKNSGLIQYFDSVIISEEIGFAKPDVKIFEKAFEISKTTPKASMMVGDDLAIDVLGGMNAGMKGCYFNPEKIKHSEKVSIEIIQLTELIKLL